MRIIVSDFISLDGVVQAPGGAEEDTDGGFAHGGWSMPYFDPEVMGASIGKAMESTEALLFGRRTWRVMADAWPNREGDEFADHMNSIQKYVASRTLTEADLDWNNTSLLPADDAVGAVRELVERLSAEFPQRPQLFVTGGDLRRLAPLVAGDARFVPNMVLAGLAIADRVASLKRPS